MGVYNAGDAPLIQGMALLTPPIHPIRSTPLGAIGMLTTLRSNALAMWGRAAYERPAIVGSFMGRPQILLNHPDAIQHVLVRNAANYRRPGISRRLLAPLIGDGLLLSEGAAWRHQRRTIAPIMAPRNMPVLTQHVTAVAEALCDRLATARDPVALLPEMQFTALEIAGRSMFSLEMAERGGPMRALLMRFATELSRPSAFDMILPAGLPTPSDRARRRFRREWMGLIGAILDARTQMPPGDGPRDLFDLLQAARDPETGAAFTREQLCDQVATMILAGHETTALALFWSFCLLAQAPDWQERAASDEAAARAVVSEALRLYPPAFLIQREALAPDTAAGIMIPRGATVSVAPWVLHRHTTLWKQPHGFDPARFMPGAPPPPRFAYLPFGAGPRVCVAAQFAMIEAVIVLSAVLGRFRVESATAALVRPVARVTTQPDRMVHFLFTPRHSKNLLVNSLIVR